MTRREVLQLATAGGIQAALGPQEGRGAGDRPTAPAFEWEEASIGQLQEAMQSGRATAASLTRSYLDRIARVDKAGPEINAIIEVNPDALAIAQALDQERRTKGPRGPLHGIPVVIKDNLDTHDRMRTTAGSLALLGSVAGQDAVVVKKLRDAGAVLLAKSNLSEWANFRSDPSSSGWSGRGGQTKNPFALDRTPSGSSSGSAAAVSANLCAAAVGTETDGSIISPSSACGIVGIKPTVGLISRSGIIPISHTQDTAGPMARSVTDAAILLSAMAGIDPLDPATRASDARAHADYARFLDAGGLAGARIGVLRRYFGAIPSAQSVMNQAIETLRKAGATLVDPLEIPTLGQLGDAEFEVLLYEFKAGINAYLSSLGPAAQVKSLEELIAFNQGHGPQEMSFFRQEIFLKAQAKGPLSDKAYLAALEKCRRLTRTEGIDAAMDKHQLDAIVAHSGGPASKIDLIYGERDIGGCSTPAAVAGYPSITVPAGEAFGLPVGLAFFGRAWSEPVLLKLAFAFEQATRARRSPKFLPGVG